jgi:hypothetical protein
VRAPIPQRTAQGFRRAEHLAESWEKLMRKIDFIVFGLARSGTTALATLLNASDSVFCGMEFFQPRDDHSQIDVPMGFVQQVETLTREKGQAPQFMIDSLEVLKAKDPSRIKLFGSKLPIYSHYLDTVMDELGTEKAVMTIRNSRACAQSYDWRSRLVNDAWPVGRTGFFAAAELMHVAKILARSTHLDILMLPQQMLSEDWRAAADAVCSYLMPGQAVDFDPLQIEAIHARRDARLRIVHSALTPENSYPHDILDGAGINAVLASDRPYMLRDRIGAVREAVKKLPDDHIGFCQDLADKHSEPEVAKYFNVWLRFT